MIIIWRGWGILAVLLPLLVAVAVHGAARSLGPRPAEGLTSVGVAMAGLVVLALGRRLNRSDARRVDAYRQTRSAELHHLVENGAFQGVPGGERPRSLEEARAQAAQLLDAEADHVRRAGRNRHTCFFVPMHWIGVVEVVWGIIAAIALLARG